MSTTHNCGSALAQLNILYSLFPLSASILKLHCIVLHTSRCFLSLGSSIPRSVFAVTSNLGAGARMFSQPSACPTWEPSRTPTPYSSGCLTPYPIFGAHDTAGVAGPITRHTREPIATNVFQKKRQHWMAILSIQRQHIPVPIYSVRHLFFLVFFAVAHAARAC